MAKFKVGDRVRVTVDSPPAWMSTWPRPKGEAGAVTSVYSTAYAVLLDNDPDQLPYAYSKDELEAES